MALVHSSASAFSTAGVVGHGPSSKVSTTSFSVRKSSCLNCWKPKPGPPVVSATTTRLTPSASALAHFCWPGAGAGAAGLGWLERAAVTSTSSRGAAGLAATGSGSAFLALTVCGAAASARGDEVQNHTPAITTAETTLANIRANALRIGTLSTKFNRLVQGPLMQTRS